jgi:hypothetical protein
MHEYDRINPREFRDDFSDYSSQDEEDVEEEEEEKEEEIYSHDNVTHIGASGLVNLDDIFAHMDTPDYIKEQSKPMTMNMKIDHLYAFVCHKYDGVKKNETLDFVRGHRHTGYQIMSKLLGNVGSVLNNGIVVIEGEQLAIKIHTKSPLNRINEPDCALISGTYNFQIDSLVRDNKIVRKVSGHAVAYANTPNGIRFFDSNNAVTPFTRKELTRQKEYKPMTHIKDNSTVALYLIENPSLSGGMYASPESKFSQPTYRLGPRSHQKHIRRKLTSIPTDNQETLLKDMTEEDFGLTIILSLLAYMTDPSRNNNINAKYFDGGNTKVSGKNILAYLSLLGLSVGMSCLGSM